VRANFFAEPAPTWEFVAPSKRGFIEKKEFVESRMKSWFG